MKPGTESQTAVMVCVARAVAHGRTSVPKFADPTALTLLPADARERAERQRAGSPPANGREKLHRKFVEARATMMALRTVAVDEAVRAAQNPQVVILGAGLDGRAWRMPELASATVFEVDHPDSQRRKRERASALELQAREVRFVAVDFARDDLDDALAAAGHDPSRPTTWIWEGVVMYLELSAIEATLAIVKRRSAAGSRLVVVYNAPSWMSRIVGVLVRRIGEPFRSAFTADQMRALLARHGFETRQDENIPELGARLASAAGPGLGREVRHMRHARVAVADRATG
jgi:methyltransferase (TIGR00027 family)